MENKIDFSNLETFLDSAQAILMQKIQEADLNPETRFDLEIFEIPKLRNQVKEIFLKYIKNPESDQWLFELLQKRSRTQRKLDIYKIFEEISMLELNSWKDLKQEIFKIKLEVRSNILSKVRNKKYYQNTPKVRKDLENLAKAVFKDKYKENLSIIIISIHLIKSK